MECGAFISMTTTLEHLYHGSPNHIEGKVEPRQGKDISKKPENNLLGIYATDNIEIAICKAILSCRGIRGLTYLDSKGKKPPYGVIFSGWPKAEYIYIYKLPTATFRRVSKNSWMSPVPIMPIEVRVMKVRDCIYVVRKATLLEKIHLFFEHSPTSALRYLGFNKL
jgi:hypothetical protein